MNKAIHASLDTVVDNLDCAIVILDRDLRVEYANHLLLEFWPVDPGFLERRPSLGEVVERLKSSELYDVSDGQWEFWIGRQGAGRADAGEAQEFVLRDGRVIRTRSVPLDDGRCMITHYDITELKRRELEIKRHAETLEVVQESVEQGLTWFDENLNLRAFNGKLLQLLDFPPDLFKLGENLETFFRYNAERGEYGTGDIEEMVAERIELVKRFEPHEFERTRVDGRIIQIRGTIVPQGGFVTTYTDVTEQRRAQRQIEFLAHHDVLTELPNRASFNRELEAAMADAREQGSLCALMCFDLDHFKEVNDSLGHPAGDLLLTEFSARAARCVGGSGRLYRLGGDEFAIIFAGRSNVDLCAGVAAGLIEEAAWPYLLNGTCVKAGGSAGIALFDPACEDIDATEMLRRADVALYNVKRAERGSYEFHDKDKEARFDRHSELKRDMRKGVERDEFFVLYQPFVDASSHRPIGVEALVRWQHPVHGLIEPADFIGLAEESDLICDIGAHVLRTACTAFGGQSDLRLAVNLSPIQFRQQDVVGLVRSVLEETGFDPRQLELEITENVMLVESTDTLEILSGLKALGVSIVLDDFGTGYSSLIYLHRFKFDKLKVDRHFVVDCDTDAESLAIVKSILGLSKSLGVRSHGEGIETAGQAQLLRQEGCDELQGFLFGRPMSFEALQDMIHEDMGAATEKAGRVEWPSGSASNAG